MVPRRRPANHLDALPQYQFRDRNRARVLARSAIAQPAYGRACLAAMTPPTKTDALAALRNPQPASLDSLVALTYDELRRIARRHLARGRRVGVRSGTLGTTALVNEAYLKLVDQSNAGPKDRAHFLAIAAVAMRHILIDRARARSA